ncbi:TIGR04211 family SH3 domain-containing protein [Steroidobacter denitrificans]|nr:TIGR04211 family SH3 domain-containing protein [Steroidobacter denitrificans]
MPNFILPKELLLMRMSLPAISILCCALLLGSLPASAAKRYISDELAVPLRRGPSTGHRILHAGLPSGMELEVLGEDSAAGFTQVRTPNGTEGWVPTQYLTAQPIARDRLAAANRRIESLEAQLKSVRDSYKDASGARNEMASRTADLDKQVDRLQSELAEVRSVSAAAIAHFEENKQLKSSNESLRAKVMALNAQVEQLERNTLLRWLLAGGALVLIGLLLGAWLKSRPRRSQWA